MADIVAGLAKMGPADLIVFLIILGFAFVIYLILTRRLVSRADLTDVRADRDAQVARAYAEADEWKAAYRASETRAETRDAQFGDLLETARATDQFIRGLPEVVRTAIREGRA